jgi:hypothetical protein
LLTFPSPEAWNLEEIEGNTDERAFALATAAPKVIIDDRCGDESLPCHGLGLRR